MISSFCPARAVGREGMRLVSKNRVAEPWVLLAKQLQLNIGSGALACSPGCLGERSSDPFLGCFAKTTPF